MGSVKLVYTNDVVIDNKKVLDICMRLNKKFTNVVFEPYELFTELDCYLGCVTAVSISLMYTGRVQDPKGVVRAFLKAHTVLPDIISILHRMKLDIVNLKYEFEGEPDPKRISSEISFSVCRRR